MTEFSSMPALVVAGLLLVPALVAVVAALRWREGMLAERARQAEEAARRLRESERKFRALFDASPDGHVLLQGEAIIAANPTATALAGASPSDMGLALLRQRLEPLLEGPLAAVGGEPRTLAWDLERPGEAPLPLMVTATPIPLEDREVLHLVLRDISAERRAAAEREILERQLRDAQRLESIGTLAGGVAHDFNNLLTVIRGNTELALHELPPDAGELRESLEAVVGASDRARAIVRQMLAFGSPGRAAATTVELPKLVQGMVPILRSSVPATVRLEVLTPPERCAVAGDPAQLEQVLLNLCTNAEYAMRATGGGTLTVAVDETVLGVAPARALDLDPGPYIRLRVSDTGEGMPPEVRERIFEPFYTTKPVGQGTGLGLAVLFGIVQAHGGRVAVESERGMGTTFTVLLPAAGEAAAGADEPALPRGGIWTARVLLVDDDPAVARALRRLVEWFGCQVTTLTDPHAALAELRRDPDAIDLLLTDLTMPGLSGDVLVAEARAIRPALPAIVATGYSHRLTPTRIAQIGGAVVLEKPLLADALQAALRELLGPPAAAAAPPPGVPAPA